MPRAATANRTIRARTRRVLCILTVIFTFLTLGFAGASTFLFGVAKAQWLPTILGLLGITLYMLSLHAMVTNIEEINTGAYDQRLTQRKQTKQNQKK